MIRELGGIGVGALLALCAAQVAWSGHSPRSEMV